MSSLPTPVPVEADQWDARLAAIDVSGEKFLCEGHPSAEITQMLQRFLEPVGDPFRLFILGANSPFYFFQDFAGQDSKDKARATVEFHIERFSPLAKLKSRAYLILEELLLNATISAPRVAEIEKVTAAQRPSRVRIEWNDTSFWIHVIDPYGVFHRMNFVNSFRVEGLPTRGHGNSGRGLKIVFEHADDLWIRSAKDWGTVVSARISLIKTQFPPKTFFGEFV